MKRKSLAALLSGLLTVSLTGVGFASWLIVQNATDSKTGTVSVEDVSVKQVVINFAWLDNNGDGTANSTGDNILSFGYKGAENQNGWFRNTDSTHESAPVLKFNLSASVKDDASATATAGVTITVNEKSGGNGYATAKTKNYISDVVVEAAPAGETTYTHCIKIKWGSEFGTVNPYDYYNAKTYSPDLANEAKTKIEELNSLLNGVTFTLSLTGTYNG